MRILVADDEPTIADTLGMVLSQNGFEVAVAHGGRSALEMARTFCPRIFLSDVVMPETNGIEAAIAIRAILPECRIVLLSGQAGVHDLLKEARSHGYKFELLLKPIHPSDLLDYLRALGECQLGGQANQA